MECQCSTSTKLQDLQGNGWLGQHARRLCRVGWTLWWVVGAVYSACTTTVWDPVAFVDAEGASLPVTQALSHQVGLMYLDSPHPLGDPCLASWLWPVGWDHALVLFEHICVVWLDRSCPPCTPPRVLQWGVGRCTPYWPLHPPSTAALPMRRASPVYYAVTTQAQHIDYRWDGPGTLRRLMVPSGSRVSGCECKCVW